MTQGSREVIWEPRANDLERSNVARLMAGHRIVVVEELRRRSAADPEWFYRAIREDLGIAWMREPDRLMDATRGLPWTEWFLGGEMNLVHNVLDRPLASGFHDLPAVIAEDDAERVVTLTYGALDTRVRALAAAMTRRGVGPGDSVGLYLPMSAETVVALLACLKVGAVAVPVFAGFGPDALASRLVDSSAKLLLTADGTRRRGKLVPLKPIADRALDACPSVQTVFVLRHAGNDVDLRGGRDSWWHDVAADAPAIETVALDASARAMILYTSGTTGRPKGAVHTHAGVQYVTAKEVGYHMDVRPGDVMFWLTDIGWMMGPWEILGVLFHRGTVVLLDGAPDFPDADRVWRMVARHRVTHLALAPTAVRVIAQHSPHPGRTHDLSSVRMLGSTGEPWDDASYLWYFENAGGGRCPVINISGGTELMGCLLAPLAVAPLKACTLQGPALGMDVDVVDDRGRSVRGEVGYLVCRNAAPNMTRGFLDDPDRYLATYFTQFGDSVWSHGDWAIVDDDGFWFLTGRADDTLKIAGKRVGPGEVEAAAVAHEAVREAAAVGLDDPVKGTRLVVVAVASEGHAPGPDLSARVAAHVASRLGSTMRPSLVLWVDALPVTRSGKIVRAAIRRALAGEDPGNLAMIANPEAVSAIQSLAARDLGPRPPG